MMCKDEIEDLVDCNVDAEPSLPGCSIDCAFDNTPVAPAPMPTNNGGTCIHKQDKYTDCLASKLSQLKWRIAVPVFLTSSSRPSQQPLVVALKHKFAVA